ncbi:hypothetical protein [Ferrimonas balearica]|uniref:hypothetical protein n=1 Tax=Ferrimonas balearica TaxID=44012 RepID=UPI001C9A1BAE|nr:hypothetical protein [Ferrimonas balearica]MBY5921697.1 hypothetical protein [Ferrimonas balearica]MBY5994963.1 hypothetical protein [Ferrimonas balearica]
MATVRYSPLCAASILLALSSVASASEAPTLPKATIAACEGMKAGDNCTIVGPTGIETGGLCQHHPKTEQLFCQPEGMPESIILEKPKQGQETPPDPNQ